MRSILITIFLILLLFVIYKTIRGVFGWLAGLRRKPDTFASMLNTHDGVAMHSINKSAKILEKEEFKNEIQDKQEFKNKINDQLGQAVSFLKKIAGYLYLLLKSLFGFALLVFSIYLLRDFKIWPSIASSGVSAYVMHTVIKDISLNYRRIRFIVSCIYIPSIFIFLVTFILKVSIDIMVNMD